MSRMVGRVLNGLQNVDRPFQQPPEPAKGYHDEHKRPELGLQRVQPNMYDKAMKLKHLFFSPPAPGADELEEVDRWEAQPDVIAAASGSAPGASSSSGHRVVIVPDSQLPAGVPPTATQRKMATEAATMDQRAQAAQSHWPVDPPGPAGVATAGPALKQRDTEVDTVSEDSADEEKKDRFSEDEDEGAKPLGKDPYFGNWTVDQFSLPLGFMKIPEAHGGLLLPLLQLKAGEGEEMEIAQLTATLKSQLEARGEVFDEFREIRLNYHILTLRDQNKWLLKERMDCIQWSVDKEYDGIPAFITEPKDPQYDATAVGPQLTEQAALRCRGKAHTYVCTYNCNKLRYNILILY